jgi:hypothetical protein
MQKRAVLEEQIAASMEENDTMRDDAGILRIWLAMSILLFASARPPRWSIVNQGRDQGRDTVPPY